MEPAYAIEQIREAERLAYEDLPEDTLMQRAAFGLATHCARLLRAERGLVVGGHVVALVGAGNNGGDALWAAAHLARRGVSVTAVLLAAVWHRDGAVALARSGGRVEPVDLDLHGRLINEADVVLDAVLGIGGIGALRSPAAEVAALAAASSATVVAVDLPSGVDADTGAVADPNAVVVAEETVTFGSLKPGLLVSPGADYAGRVTVIDIGLKLAAVGAPVLHRVTEVDAALLLPKPGSRDDKYTRGVVGVVAGSQPYPGAGVLCTGSARLGGSGMVRYAGAAPDPVIARWPEVVVASGGPANAGQVQAWVAGPGAGVDEQAHSRLVEVLQSDVAAVIDADGLTLLAQNEELRDLVTERRREGLVTILTPHAGEFARFGFPLAQGADGDRVGAVRAAAASLGAVVLLKGHETVVAEPGGAAFVNTLSDSALATAGSGDVLSGLLGSMLAAEVARNPGIDLTAAAELAACAALVHGLAGRSAASQGAPVTSAAVLAAVPHAISSLRQHSDVGGVGHGTQEPEDGHA
ncbi:MAG: NAD(P)H-hydrate dehydratase [Candidatus Nanopelagicales bacterium]